MHGNFTKPTEAREGRAAGALRITNVVAPVKEHEVIENVASKENARPVFPFIAIVGQEEMKMCLILNVIDPKIGGVMIMGDRGTGKSTTVRALVDLLPEIEVVAGNPFNSSPNDPELMSEEVRKRVQAKEQLSVVTSRINMVGLPLGATEDRVCGTIDIEKVSEPRLLAKVNHGILYVDEVGTVKDAALRVKIVEERGMFDANPKAFRVNYDVTQKELRDQIDNARAILPNVKVPHDLRVKISQVCSELDVDGLRGDIVSNRAAKALAAFRGRAEVTPEDVGTVMPNCLRHRLRKDPLESIDSGTLVIDKFNEIFGYSS